MIIKARDLRPGDVMGVAGKPALIEAARYADGKDGEPVKYAAPTPENPKSAVAMKLKIGGDTHFVHPAKEIALIRRNATSLDHSTQ
jgi:hypothetical protein